MTANRLRVRVRVQGGRILFSFLFALIASTAAAQPITYYLSEGATSDFFDNDVLIANPNNVTAPVTLTFSTQAGEQIVETRNVPARSRSTVRVDQIAGLATASASVRVRSDDGVPLFV